MCQCFLAGKIPSSMNIPDAAEGPDGSTGGSGSRADPPFETARAQGVIIKTPTEGPNQQMSENDLVVESLVLRQLRHPNIVGILGGGKTSAGSRWGQGGGGTEASGWVVNGETCRGARLGVCIRSVRQRDYRNTTRKLELACSSGSAFALSALHATTPRNRGSLYP